MDRSGTTSGGVFIEVDMHQRAKRGQVVCGDVLVSRRDPVRRRIVSVLADGLGSGVKANVLATLTGTMALRFILEDMAPEKAAKAIMDTLPVCRERKIGYSTFTIVDVDAGGGARIIEHENPACLLFRGAVPMDFPRNDIPFSPRKRQGREHLLQCAMVQLREGDRIIVFSDGVTQSGMGAPQMPLGWGADAVREFAAGCIRENPEISARELARRLTDAAVRQDGGKLKDDISCGVIHARQPRRLLVVTGPPFDRGNDPLLARRVEAFAGAVVLCGGTTATIVSRVLGREIKADLSAFTSDVPPACTMAGVALVTEGTLTLGKVTEILEQGLVPEELPENGASRLAHLLLESDIVQFLVGTRINEAHQDPSASVELDIRRNIVRKITTLLEERYRKETRVEYV